MTNSTSTCPMCHSYNVRSFNSYKHYCFACGDCNGVFHVKKQGRYLFEYIFPSSLARKLLPEKAFLRLFRGPEDYKPSSFYEVYKAECANPNDIRKSEVHELKDNLELVDVRFDNKAVLDISGGPGLVIKELNGVARRAVVTEYNEEATEAMGALLGVEAYKFDYITDSLDEIFQEKFDIVLLRSSIIFCDQLERLILSIDRILNEGGYVLVETITPTLGEVFWWQQMEYKFPVIYSQEFIEKVFYKHGYSLLVAHREYGDYVSNKWRRRTKIARKLFTWLIDYPMMLAYYFMAPKRKIPIDQRSHHKMLTQIWKKQHFKDGDPAPIYRNTQIGDDAQSTHFTQVYNGWLNRKK